jgi:hypothetical protein
LQIEDCRLQILANSRFNLTVVQSAIFTLQSAMLQSGPEEREANKKRLFPEDKKRRGGLPAILSFPDAPGGT